jgi:hypothetical protein
LNSLVGRHLEFARRKSVIFDGDRKFLGAQFDRNKRSGYHQ